MSEATSRQPIVEMNDVQVTALRDASIVVLENVNWTVSAGEFWVVAGPPHSGKSDLLQHAAGLTPPSAGTCRVFGINTIELGENQLAERLRIGYVFADGRLFHELTLAENIALPLQYHRNLPAAEAAPTVAALLEMLELTPFADFTPGSVAAVWRHRAALARALALKPELLFLDNPNSGLTARHRQWLIDFLDQLCQGHEFLDRRPATVVVTTEDLPIWEHPNRRFAVVHAGAFTTLGAWGTPDFTSHKAVLELLVAPPEPKGNS
jgi:ABC-type transporter Mla maintaining outer membrane lipid asymmetry ATPase subunit MlaF